MTNKMVTKVPHCAPTQQRKSICKLNPKDRKHSDLIANNINIMVSKQRQILSRQIYMPPSKAHATTIIPTGSFIYLVCLTYSLWPLVWVEGDCRM